MLKQYPSQGDQGTSKLSTGEMAGKDHANFEAVGTVDELNCVLGWVKSACCDKALSDRISWVQSRLLDLGGYITGWAKGEFPAGATARLEQEIGEWQKVVPNIQAFILPDGAELAARFHVARSVARRLERRVVGLTTAGVRPVSTDALQFVNRLSDWLFMAARWANVQAGVQEQTWQKEI